MFLRCLAELSGFWHVWAPLVALAIVTPPTALAVPLVEKQLIDLAILPLRLDEKLALLTGATITRAFMLPGEDVELLPLYARLAMQAPLRVLSYPSGFEHQDAVYARLRSDLAER